MTVNRAVEVNEMWRVRQKELELDDKLKSRSRDYHSDSGRDGDRDRDMSGNQSKRHNSNTRHDSNTSCSSSKRSYEEHSNVDEGLKDEEIEEFLRSRSVNLLLQSTVLHVFSTVLFVFSFYP